MPDFGDGSPRENYGAANPSDVSLSPEQWAEYQKKRHRDALRLILSTFGATTGLGAIGAAAGAGAGAGGFASVPGAVGASAPPLGAGTVVGGAGGIGAGAGAGLGSGAAGGIGSKIGQTGSDVVRGASNGLDTRDLIALATSLAGIGGAAFTPRPSSDPSSATTDPNMQKLIASMQGRLDQSEPLYKSIMAMSNGLLPTQYQNGGAGRG